MARSLLSILGAACWLIWANSAFADVVPPEVAACNNLDAGAPCSVGLGSIPYGSNASISGGDCRAATCSKLDYSHGSPPTGTIEYPCLKCTQAGAPPVANAGSSGTGPLPVAAGGGTGPVSIVTAGTTASSSSTVELGTAGLSGGAGGQFTQNTSGSAGTASSVGTNETPVAGAPAKIKSTTSSCSCRTAGGSSGYVTVCGLLVAAGLLNRLRRRATR